MEENNIPSSSDANSRLNAVENKEEYFARLERAIQNVENGKGISISNEELEGYFEEMK